MMEPTPPANPFPGLRPFEADEDHLFFGREKEIDDLLRRLGSHRFLSVVGTSGCGKSSLVRSGLIPVAAQRRDGEGRLELAHRRHAARARIRSAIWPTALDAPGRARARAASSPAPAASCSKPRCAAARSASSTPSARRASLPDDNVLVVVDQFEELFRFRRSGDVERSRDEAVGVRQAAARGGADRTAVPDLRRADDALRLHRRLHGVPGAAGGGQRGPVPGAAHDARRTAAGDHRARSRSPADEIAPRLVLRLLNDIGDDQDELPLLQHALMRTWDHWSRARASQARRSISRTTRRSARSKNALSMHAEEAYEETGSERGKRIAGADLPGAHRHVHRSARRAASDVGRRSRGDLRGAGGRGHRGRRDVPPARPLVPDAAAIGAARRRTSSSICRTRA